MIRERLKWWLFPGLNLHLRLRRRRLPGYFGAPRNGEQRDVLDAGCGNGMLAYESYLQGNRVLGISIKQHEVEGNQRLFNDYLGVPKDRLSFEFMNLYELAQIGRTFDEIICTEVLEHIVDDEGVCQSFYDVLRPGGVLHLCCPNADHPYHRAQRLDQHESGGHVRSGYTLESYRGLLEPIGFDIDKVAGLGGPFRQAINRRITAIQHFGVPAGLVLYLATLPLHNLDRADPRVPYSLYVRAVKPVAVKNRQRSSDCRDTECSAASGEASKTRGRSGLAGVTSAGKM